MSRQYTIKTVSAVMNNLSIAVAVENPNVIELQANTQNRMRRPEKKDDPTVMLEVLAEVSDKDNQIKVVCNLEIVFEFSPIPSDWREAVKENCTPLIQRELAGRIGGVLNAMGHSVSFVENK